MHVAAIHHHKNLVQVKHLFQMQTKIGWNDTRQIMNRRFLVTLVLRMLRKKRD